MCSKQAANITRSQQLQTNSPLDQLDAVKLDAWLTKHKKKLASCMLAGADGDSSDDESESEVEEESEEDEDDNDSD